MGFDDLYFTTTMTITIITTTELIAALAAAEKKIQEAEHAVNFSTWYSGRSENLRTLRRWERKANKIRASLGYGLNAPIQVSR